MGKREGRETAMRGEVGRGNERERKRVPWRRTKYPGNKISNLSAIVHC